MKQKILAKLVVKYKGLSKQLLGLVADKMAAKVTEESEIEGAIAELDEMLIPVPEYAKLLQQEGDRRVTEAKKTFQQTADDTEDDPEDNSEEPEQKSKSKNKGGNDPIAKLAQQIQNLTTEITSFKQKEQQQTLSQKLAAALKEKKIPEVLMKGRVVEKEEDLETVIAEIEADHTALKQELNNEALGSGGRPIVGGGAPADKTKITSDIDAWAKANTPKTDSKTT